MPELTVIIPTWNRRDLLENCLLSLREQTAPCRLLVVDNGSTDGTPEMVRQLTLSFPTPIQYLNLGANLGFARAVNAGIRAAQTPCLALLNNDTEAEKGWAEAGLQAFSRYPDYSFFACKILDYRDRSRLDSAGDRYNRQGIASKRGYRQPAERFSEPEPVLAAGAAAAFYRRSLFDEVGLFDEDFYMYLEDVELSLRAQLCGHRCLYLPNAVVYHIEGGSWGEQKSPPTYWITRNRWQLMITYQPFSHLPWLLYGWALSLVHYLLKEPLCLGAFLRGLAAGILQTGKALHKRRRLA